VSKMSLGEFFISAELFANIGRFDDPISSYLKITSKMIIF
jgi:hypothetical protein